MKSIDVRSYLVDLETLVNIDSVSTDPAGTTQVGNFLAEKFKGLGWQIKSEVYDDTIGPCLKITNSESDKYDILLLAHMDTVFPIGTAKERPYSEKDGRAYGPGVIDCKAGLLSIFYVLESMQQEGKLENASICVFYNSDHEGISSKFSHSHSVELAEKSRYVLVLEGARANGNLVHQRKGIARYKLSIDGVGAHAGVDFTSGRSAINELGSWIMTLEQATDLTKETTVNVGKASGGTSVSAVADHASAEIDVRYYQLEELKRIEQIMSDMIKAPHVEGTTAKVEGGVSRPPMLPNDETRALMKQIENIGQELNIPFGWTASGGGSDGSFAAAAGIPTIDGFGPVGGGAHSVREYMEIDTIEPRMCLLEKTIEYIIAAK